MILKSLISFTISMVMMPQVHGGDYDFILSSKIPKEQRATLKRDIKELKEMSFGVSADPKTLEIMGINDLNSDTAFSWLKDRVSTVIEDADVNKLKISSRPFFSYPNTGDALVESALPAPSDGRGGKGVTVMSNIGTGLYFAGKSSSQLLTLKVKTGFFSSKKLAITSPRTGIIQIGEGLFMKKYLMNKTDELSKANGLGRMAVFFHEARHSDGNGSSLGFFHAVCPTDHDFAGAHACDRNLNGPYSVGAQMMKEFIKNCESCTVSEKEVMRLRYLDSMNRVLKTTAKFDTSASVEVARLQTTLELTKNIYQLEITMGKPTRATYDKIISLEKQLLAQAKEDNALELIPSRNWNARSESVNL